MDIDHDGGGERGEMEWDGKKWEWVELIRLMSGG